MLVLLLLVFIIIIISIFLFEFEEVIDLSFFVLDMIINVCFVVDSGGMWELFFFWVFGFWCLWEYWIGCIRGRIFMENMRGGMVGMGVNRCDRESK